MRIRPAKHEDCTAIAEFWNPFIRCSEVTFNSIEKTPADLATELERKSAADQPFLVVDEAGSILGFATYGQFRASNGYRLTMEHTIILAPEASGKGIGRDLMHRIEDHARERGVHSMLAGISHRNPQGIAFHVALGYSEMARLPEVGVKFDRWFDLVLMQKFL